MTQNILGRFGKPKIPVSPVIIGKQRIIYNNIEKNIEEFYSLYQKMPIKDNYYGMQSPHLFLLWYALRQINPDVIIESGVYKGLGTWWIKQACPYSKIYSIDVDLSNVEYIDENVTYLNTDFSNHKWDGIDKRKTIIFFDDHQNALDRLMQMKWMGFSMAIFDDNYMPFTGDCYSCKKILSQTGNQWGWDLREANDVDSFFFMENIATYQELLAPFRREKNRFGFDWKEPPLLVSPETMAQQLLYKEAMSYTHICFVELKHS